MGLIYLTEMDKNKKIFLAVAIIFLLIVFFIAYDISRRTTFPGQNRNQPAESEQLKNDSL